ncbi:uncharacterized protein LOC110036368 [Phalaenopsis equestris]|uniref:uncharacterized protein LOC110036368 n=1 Tax=Phalaenopsis equestris TaxID=78828 RepID=UPI0009E38673|nr:uncharacterized protein LOC110036368 [Phalaenopsis equestris]
MGREMDGEEEGAVGFPQSKPGVLLIGCPNIGKRTLLSRLLSIDIPDISNLSSGIFCQGWTIETKYYSAELSIWTAHLDDGISLQRLLASKQLAALVMVFDMSDESSFLTLKDWVSGIDIGNFQILLCIGNKADLVPGHYAHTEYRRHLQKKQGELTGDPDPEFWDYGISETESCSLLGNEDLSVEIKNSCMVWCIEHNIEYIEACASNADFDKCLSVDGDVQGVERLYGALAAHMWPGMILKSGNLIKFPDLVEREDFTEDESDYEFEYEVLSGGAGEPWDSTYDPGASSSMLKTDKIDSESGEEDGILGPNNQIHRNENVDRAAVDTESEVATEREHDADKVLFVDQKLEQNTQQGQSSNSDEDLQFGYDDLERLMGEIGNIRGNLRLMPDFQRREMAAKLALKMAAMFGESSDEDGL